MSDKNIPKREAEDCIFYHDGFCLKGLAGTRCDLIGCVAYQDKPVTHPIPSYPFPTEKEHRNDMNRLQRLVLTWQDIKRIVNIADDLLRDDSVLSSEEEYYTAILKAFNQEK